MSKIHNLGFPRVGAHRQLKFALEGYFRGELESAELEERARLIRIENIRTQRALDLVPVGDFSLYDHVLDTSFLVGNVPSRASFGSDDRLASYFRVARGRSACDGAGGGVVAGEMTKWFDTNYHYIVPEFHEELSFELRAEFLLAQVREARERGVHVKPVLLGPVSYLLLGKAKDGVNPISLLARLIPVYRRLLGRLSSEGVEWVQIDEPTLALDLDSVQKDAFRVAYEGLASSGPKLLLTSYFGPLRDNLDLVTELPVAGIHHDCVRAAEEVQFLVERLKEHQVFSLGVIDGRNVWRADLSALLDWLEPIHERLGDRLWLAPSCSLLHVPVDLRSETKLDAELKSWLAFAVQKLEELKVLKGALDRGRDFVGEALLENQRARLSRLQAPSSFDPSVRAQVAELSRKRLGRKGPYAKRAALQAKRLSLPLFPTTTIGSFPQTKEIRKARADYRQRRISFERYEKFMRDEIAVAVARQEEVGLDVLVHGEAERNDMVEYFGQRLSGFVFTQAGWVQSYGSRCVKPPILYGDVAFREPMTVPWTQYASSLTNKPMKGMLTGPVTILNWSFVRDDQAREQSCLQIAVALAEEVRALEAASVPVIQIDEAALREGLPLRRADWQYYLDWAVRAFHVCTAELSDETQVHTHMCYSEFNDIIEAIALMDADVITIESSRSGMELLSAFESFEYPNQIGPGVYDIHSPNVPRIEDIVGRMKQAQALIPQERLWINPDCGLKTRNWKEVLPALQNLVAAARVLRGTPFSEAPENRAG